MTFYEFNALSATQQADAICEGVIIGGRDDNGQKILLYQLDAFYVEVYYNSKSDFISRLRAFSSTDLLQPYLEKIDLNEKF